MAGVAFAALAGAGAVPPATGNRHPRWAPQGCYPARGEDQWIVVSCTDDDEWAACAALIGRPDLAGAHARRAPGPPRRARRRDRRVERAGRRTGGRRRAAGRRRPGRAGARHAHAQGRSPPVRPRLLDPGARTRRCTRTASTAWCGGCSRPNPRITRHAPYLGADNHEILGGLLGLGRRGARPAPRRGRDRRRPVNPGVG